MTSTRLSNLPAGERFHYYAPLSHTWYYMTKVLGSLAIDDDTGQADNLVTNLEVHIGWDKHEPTGRTETNPLYSLITTTR